MIDIKKKRVAAKTLTAGQFFLIPERMDDGDGNIEIRLELNQMDTGTQNVQISVDPEQTKDWLCVTSFGLIQGEPNSKPRHVFINENGIQSCIDPNFMVIPTDLTSLKDVTIPPDPKAQPVKKKQTERVFSNSEKAMREILVIMHRGWDLYEASFDKETGVYTRNKVECMIEAAGGNLDVGYLTYLFDHWDNNIQMVAPHLGVGWGKDGTVRQDIPPMPSDGGNCKTGYKLEWVPQINKWDKFGAKEKLFQEKLQKESNQ